MKTTLLFILVTLSLAAFADDDLRFARRANDHALPNGAPEGRGTREQQLAYGLAMGRAYQCVGLQAQAFLNYGCFCGEGNTGIDTEPADAVDDKCRMHDVNLWAISENPKYNNGATSCNCYTEVLKFSCNAGKIELVKDMSACQRACGDDLVALAIATKNDFQDYHREYSHRWQPFGTEFRIPNYCKKLAKNPPKCPFTPLNGEVAIPDHNFWPIGK